MITDPPEESPRSPSQIHAAAFQAGFMARLLAALIESPTRLVVPIRRRVLEDIVVTLNRLSVVVRTLDEENRKYAEALEKLGKKED